MKRSSVVAIIQNNEGEILLLKRHPYDRTLPNVYCLPGGKVDKDETLSMAVIREVKEETNFKVTGINNLCQEENERFVINFFVCTVEDSSLLELTLSDEHEGFTWASKEAIEYYLPVADITKKVLLKYLENE